MKNLFFALGLVPFLAGCGGNTEPEKEIIIEKDTVVVTESAPKDSFMVFGHLEFPSGDGLTITANSYEIIPSDEYILLCHQAGYSRGEYREIAKQLNALGYNCLAIDQRSGKECNAMINETAMRAEQEGKATDYMSAEQDITAAIDYIYHKTNRKMILWGSSYSASLALKIAKENDKIEAVVAFSPGEYLKDFNLEEAISGLNKPMFVTGAKKEMKNIEKVVSKVNAEHKEIFTPAQDGIHGSSALWDSTPDHAEYWDALKTFLNKTKQPEL